MVHSTSLASTRQRSAHKVYEGMLSIKCGGGTGSQASPSDTSCMQTTASDRGLLAADTHLLQALLSAHRATCSVSEALSPPSSLSKAHGLAYPSLYILAKPATSLPPELPERMPVSFCPCGMQPQPCSSPSTNNSLLVLKT